VIFLVTLESLLKAEVALPHGCLWKLAGSERYETQAVRTDMRTDHRRHIDQWHICQVGFQVIQQLAGAVFCIGMEDNQALQLALFLKYLENTQVGLVGGAGCAKAFHLTLDKFHKRLQIE